MSAAEPFSQPTGARRYRHRSPRRKLAEMLLMMIGVPLLLFVVLSLSVELIEYHPSSGGATLEQSTRRAPASRLEPGAFDPARTDSAVRTRLE